VRARRTTAIASGLLAALVVGAPLPALAYVAAEPGGVDVREVTSPPVPMPHVRHRGPRPVPIPEVEPRDRPVPMPRVGERGPDLLLMPGSPDRP
jgi:hypothetical protein